MENSLSIALVVSFIATVGVFGVRKIQVKVFDIRKVLAHLVTCNSLLNCTTGVVRFFVVFRNL